jgi:hypothetical protein
MKYEVTLRQGSVQRYPVVLRRDIKHLCEVRGLLGEQKAASLREGEHPLAEGLRLARKYLTTPRLAGDEETALQQAVLFAKTFCEVRHAWDGHRSEMARTLLDADRCRTLMFELDVIRYALMGRVGHVDWSPWAEGPDILTSDPILQIECKLILSDDLDRLFKKVADARAQRRADDVPFVAAVGFKDKFASEPEQALSDLCKRHGGLLVAPDLSATLFFLPLRLESQSQVLGLRIVSSDYGVFWETHNPMATNPLPDGFRFGARPQSMIGRATVR